MINVNVIYIFILWAIRIYNVNPLVWICIDCEYFYNSNKRVTLSELLPNINKFPNKILNVFQKVSRMWHLNRSSYWYISWIPLFFSRNALQWIHVVLLQNWVHWVHQNWVHLQNWVHFPIFFTPWSREWIPRLNFILYYFVRKLTSENLYHCFEINKSNTVIKRIQTQTVTWSHRNFHQLS